MSHSNRRPRTFTRIALVAALLLGALAIAPSPAQACMHEAFRGPAFQKPVVRPAAPLLLAKAKQNMRRGKMGLSLSQATTVLGDERATTQEKAQAYTVVGWVRWSRGNRDSAMEALRRGKEMDANASVAVLDEAQDPFLRHLILTALAA